MTKIRQTVDTSEADRAFVADFHDKVDHLVGLVLEAVRDNPQFLLSPVMRKVLVDAVVRVKELSGPLHGRLAADNPCGDLKPWKE